MKTDFPFLKLLIILNFGIMVISCKQEDIRMGDRLSQQYCTSCHELVRPETLSKDYWQSVLLRMSAHLGFSQGTPFYGQTKIARDRLADAHIFPDSQLISTEDWQTLVRYYLDHSPDSLDQGHRPTIDLSLKQFSPRRIPWLTPLNGLTYLNIKDKNRIIAGYNYQGDSNKVHIIDVDGHELNQISLPSALTDLVPAASGKNYLVCMGPFEADDTPIGTVLLDEISEIKKPNKNHQIVLAQRERPVHLTVTDLDSDGAEDLLLSEFGKFMGGLNWYRKNDLGKWNKTVLYDGPGSLTTKIRDINNDGKPDIFALISQGNEGIYLYLNQGDGHFTERKLLSFPPYFGSVDFELFDFDQDGHEDILYINGDSGDFGHPPKPFHGIRFFKNVDREKFEEKWFYPQQGTYKIAVTDFDQDGDPDIASIGLFAVGAGMPEEGFLYLENPGEIRQASDFKTYSFGEAGTTSFMVMDHGDLDGDGDIDLLLGASTYLMSVPEKVQQLLQWESQGGAIYFLENTLY